MSAPNKSFFSGLHLLVTGLAAVTTAAVAVLGLALNQGWLSGGKTKSGGATTVATPQYAVDPTSLSFQPLGPMTASVKVSNTGLVSFTVAPPTLTGADPARFRASSGTCSGSVDPGRSCQLQVTFLPSPGTFNATLVIQVSGALQSTEVSLQASAIL